MAKVGMMNPVLMQQSPSASRELVYFNVATLLLIVISAFTTIYSTHACRALYTQLQILESSRWYLQEDYGRLVLEQSTWASHRRVETVARAELGMAAPNLADYKVIPE